jgi:hypothetical protein
MELEVCELPLRDVWKDIARIPHSYRRDVHGRQLHRGEIVKLKVNGTRKFVVLHGCRKKGARIVLIDSKLRTDLKLKNGVVYDFELERASLPGQWVWTWNASEPMYRVPAQVSLISFVLGVLGLILGIVSIRAGIAKLLQSMIHHF